MVSDKVWPLRRLVALTSSCGADARVVRTRLRNVTAGHWDGCQHDVDVALDAVGGLECIIKHAESRG